MRNLDMRVIVIGFLEGTCVAIVVDHLPVKVTLAFLAFGLLGLIHCLYGIYKELTRPVSA